MNPDVLNLPWEVQVSLASGYVAYLLAFAGLRWRHSAIDVAFITLVFGLIATDSLVFTNNHHAVVAGTVAFAAACVSGFIWRKWGRSASRSLLRGVNLTWSDDHWSALDTLCGNSAHPVSQVAVLLDDGTWLRCDDTSKFNEVPFAPCLLGPTGDVALYLTHEEMADGSVRELSSVLNADYGARITYVPAARIRRITLRHMTPS
jgi:hypothetical protein